MHLRGRDTHDIGSVSVYTSPVCTIGSEGLRCGCALEGTPSLTLFFTAHFDRLNNLIVQICNLKLIYRAEAMTLVTKPEFLAVWQAMR